VPSMTRTRCRLMVFIVAPLSPEIVALQRDERARPGGHRPQASSIPEKVRKERQHSKLTYVLCSMVGVLHKPSFETLLREYREEE
jgi:hypothetical protein